MSGGTAQLETPREKPWQAHSNLPLLFRELDRINQRDDFVVDT